MTFHAVQDLSAAVDSGRSVQQAMPVTSLSVALYQLAHDQLGGLRTSTAVVRYVLEDERDRVPVTQRGGYAHTIVRGVMRRGERRQVGDP